MALILSDERTILWISTLLYCTGFSYVLVCLTKRRTHSSIFNLSVIGTGLFLQTFGLYLRGLEVRSCPLGNIFEIVQFIVWSAVLLYLVVGPAFRVSLLGFFSSGLAAVLSTISLLVSVWDHPYELSRHGAGPWIETHAATAMFSYGVFGVLALTSVMYLLQNFGLKQKRFRGLFTLLPSIVQLDQINIRLLVTGVAVLTFSLSVGAYYWLGQGELVRLPKLLITLSIWIAYMVVLLLHRANRLLSLKFAWSCIFLFGLALISVWPVDASRAAESLDSAPDSTVKEAEWYLVQGPEAPPSFALGWRWIRAKGDSVNLRGFGNA